MIISHSTDSIQLSGYVHQFIPVENESLTIAIFQ